MQRIRYNEEEDGVFRSRKSYVSEINGAIYQLILDTNEMIYKIKNVNSERYVVVGGENINNMNVLKRTAKSALEKLGVSFTEESRARTYGLCPKGYSEEIHQLKNSYEADLKD